MRACLTCQLRDYQEHAMGYQWVSMNGELAVAIGGYVSVQISTLAVSELENLSSEPWMRPDSGILGAQRQAAFDNWFSNLPQAGSVSLIQMNRFMINQNMSLIPPTGSLPAPPAPPSPIFGHLPLLATTSAGDLIHRFEAFPRSRRITVLTVSAGTFAVPPSELSFLPSGLSVVGRLALPNVLPATFGWDLEPPASSTLRCGASVPLF